MSLKGFQWLENIGNLKLPFWGPSDYCPTNPIENTGLRCFYSGNSIIYGDSDYCSNIVSINESEYESNIEIYPNPFTDNLKIELKENQHKIESIRILNSKGQTIMHSTNIDTNIFEIDSSILPSGIYALIITDSIGKYMSHKLLKI